MSAAAGVVLMAALGGLVAFGSYLAADLVARLIRRRRLRRRAQLPPTIHGLGARLYFARRQHDHRPGHVCLVPSCCWPVR